MEGRERPRERPSEALESRARLFPERGVVPALSARPLECGFLPAGTKPQNSAAGLLMEASRSEKQEKPRVFQ